MAEVELIKEQEKIKNQITAGLNEIIEPYNKNPKYDREPEEGEVLHVFRMSIYPENLGDILQWMICYEKGLSKSTASINILYYFEDHKFVIEYDKDGSAAEAVVKTPKEVFSIVSKIVKEIIKHKDIVLASLSSRQ